MPTPTPTATPSIEATVEARLQATISAIPKPTLVPTALPTPTLTTTPIPTATSTAIPGELVGLFIEPVDEEQTDQFTQVGLGQTFEVNIITNPNEQAVPGIQAFINFDPAKLEVRDADDTRPGVQIRDGGVLIDFLPVNQVTIVDGVGHIDYAAGNLAPTGFPSPEFVLATIQFRALDVTDEEPTALDFSIAPISRKTTVSGAVGVDITGDLHNGAVEIIPR